jgi:hypothetical protein
MDDGPTVYFVYFDDDLRQFYYYDTNTEETTHDRPADGLLLDPDTMEAFQFPDPSDAGAPAADAPSGDAAPHSAATIDVTDASGHHRRHHRQSAHAHARRRRLSFIPNPDQLALPQDLKTDIVRFQGADYAREFFRERRLPRVFERSRNPFPADQVFQAEPLRAPLLLRTNQKLALDCFRLVLVYTGAGDAKKRQVLPIAKKLIGICINFPEIRDEVYFQLLKQVRKNADPDCRGRTWDLLLIIATAIPSSRDSEGEIKARLAKKAHSKDKRVADFAQFAFVRFSGRCSIGKPLEPVTVAMLRSIPKDPFLSHVTFGASIYEQLLTQAPMYPRLPIPYILYFFTNLIIEKGGERSEGIFRLSGSATVVQNMIAEVNRGSDLSAIFASGTLNEVALVFKLWFANLPERIVSGDLTQVLRSVYETDKDYIGFLDELPQAHFWTLKFLCGFLKHIAKGEAVTKMGLSNLALLFSPTVVALPPLTEISAVAEHTAVSNEFLRFLLDNWDTSDIYPLPLALLEG